MPKILYVDDEADIREIATICLELESSFEVKSVDSGPSALEMAQEWQPDLILLDVMMPGMDGPMTKAKLAESDSTSSIPVVFCTARSQPSEIELFLQLGVRGVIPKPFDPMQIAEQVKEYLSLP